MSCTVIAPSLLVGLDSVKQQPAMTSQSQVGKKKDREPLDHLYSIMQSHENKLGGGEGIEGIYGSITNKGMQKIFEKLHHNCGLDKNSVLVDIGAGLGRPLLHALYNPGIKDSFGIELDHVKVRKANAFIKNSIIDMVRRGQSSVKPPQIHCRSVEELGTLDPATHAYSFWEGIPHDGRVAFGQLFSQSRTLRGVAVVQRAIRGEEPAAMMAGLGFGPLLLLTSFPVSMSGSGARFQAYIFSKVNAASAKFLSQVRSPVAPSCHPERSPSASNVLFKADRSSVDAALVGKGGAVMSEEPAMSPRGSRGSLSPGLDQAACSPSKRSFEDVDAGTAAMGSAPMASGPNIVSKSAQEMSVMRPRTTNGALQPTVSEPKRSARLQAQQHLQQATLLDLPGFSRSRKQQAGGVVKKGK